MTLAPKVMKNALKTRNMYTVSFKAKILAGSYPSLWEQAFFKLTAKSDTIPYRNVITLIVI